MKPLVACLFTLSMFAKDPSGRKKAGKAKVAISSLHIPIVTSLGRDVIHYEMARWMHDNAKRNLPRHH